MSECTTRFLERTGLADRDRRSLCRAQQDIDMLNFSSSPHAVRRAWDLLDLEAVYLVDNHPTIYLTSTARDVRTTYRRFWSHGVAPLLMILDDREVRVYSSLNAPVRRGEDIDAQSRLVGIFDSTADALELRRLIQAVETHHIYRHEHYRKHFKPDQAVDRHLMRSLAAARRILASGKTPLKIDIIHRMLIRMIFMRYMEERRVLNSAFFDRLGAGREATFAQVLVRAPTTDRLYRIFGRLKDKFKGSLFDAAELADEREYVRDEHVETLNRLFFGQEDLASGQTVLFDVYDFSVIPINTISAIYEEFLHAEEPENGKKTGAYYTPPRLVDFTLDLATQDGFDWSDSNKRILDPGCGSGAFLVAAFNRLAEAWCRAHPNAPNRTRLKALSRILTDQITGVDINDTAARITCVSLYLALLDFLEPRDIKLLTEEHGGLPPLLRKDGTRRADAPQTVVKGDFLRTIGPVHGRAFDLVIGNPPWVSRTGNENKAFDSWKKSHPTLEAPAKQMAAAFMWQTAAVLVDGGFACLLVPSGLLCNDKTSSFQRQWFSEHRVDQVAQLADLRFFLFQGSDHPCAVIRFQRKRPSDGDTIDYLGPKAGPTELNGNRITILPEDRKTISVADVIAHARSNDAPLLWFRRQWASHRDQRLLDRLLALPRLRDHAGSANEGKRWIKGQGLQPSGVGKASLPTYDPFWEPGARFLEARSDFSIVLSQHDCVQVPLVFRRKLHRRRDPRIFQGPLVVFNKGFSKFAFSSFDVLFRHSLHSISAPDADAVVLMFLTACLASPLAQYFALHCTGKQMYRDNPLLEEVLRFPFPLPDQAPGRNADTHVSAVGEIMTDLAKHLANSELRADAAIDKAKSQLVEHVYAYYDIAPSERILIDDTVKVLAKSTTRHPGSEIPTLHPPNSEQLEVYAQTFLDVFDRWSRRSKFKLSARCIRSDSAGICVMTFTKHFGKSDKRYRAERASEALDRILIRLTELLPESCGSLEFLRHAKVFDGDDLHLVKPMTRRMWLPSAALNDVDEVAEAILMSQRSAVG